MKNRSTLANLTLSTLTLALMTSLVVLSERWWHAPLEIWGRMPAVAALVAGIAVLDASTYVAHRLMHRIPLLWRVHRVHHSDPFVDATTAFRQHPLETLVRFAFIVVPVCALGIPPAIAVAYRAISAVNALFEHSARSLPRGLEAVLVHVVVTPDMHKVHHSRDRNEADSNYGNIFSIFDRRFGTFMSSACRSTVASGLEGHDGADQQRVLSLLRLPFEA
jgi:sterol desaturase/sphingolipid hydroxylase (fatty acid hydroxylase superfamily)